MYWFQTAELCQKEGLRKYSWFSQRLFSCPKYSETRHLSNYKTLLPCLSQLVSPVSIIWTHPKCRNQLRLTRQGGDYWTRLYCLFWIAQADRRDHKMQLYSKGAIFMRGQFFYGRFSVLCQMATHTWYVCVSVSGGVQILPLPYRLKMRKQLRWRILFCCRFCPTPLVYKTLEQLWKLLSNFSLPFKHYLPPQISCRFCLTSSRHHRSSTYPLHGSRIGTSRVMKKINMWSAIWRALLPKHDFFKIQFSTELSLKWNTPICHI